MMFDQPDQFELETVSEDKVVVRKYCTDCGDVIEVKHRRKPPTRCAPCQKKKDNLWTTKKKKIDPEYREMRNRKARERYAKNKEKEQARSQTKRQKFLKEVKRKKKVQLASCDVCGNDFVKTGTHKRCSDSCRDEAKKRREEEYKEKRQQEQERREAIQKTCPVCGSLFNLLARGRTRIYCSQPCREKEKQRKQYEKVKALRGSFSTKNPPVGTRRINKSGYVRIKTNKRRNNQPLWELEHRVVAEEKYGRPLLKSETVHHKNNIRDDNRPENLELMNGSHPAGARAIDLLRHAEKIVKLYKPIEHLL